MAKIKFEFMDEDTNWSTFERDVDLLPRIGDRFSGYDDEGGYCDGVVAAVTHKGGGPTDPLIAVVTVHQ